MNKLKDNIQMSDLFINLISSNNDVLIQNPFGNYAVQQAFEVAFFRKNEIKLLKHKFKKKIVIWI